VTDGNLDAMGVLFDRYHKWIYNFFFNMKPNVALCEDLTQNVFYKALKYRHSYNGGNFASWIFRIARNLLNDALQNEKYQAHVPMEQLETIADVEQEDRSTEIQRLHAVLNTLPIADKELIVMSRFQGMKYQQIAEVISSNEVAVKTRIHRIVKKMRILYFQNNEQ